MSNNFQTILNESQKQFKQLFESENNEYTFKHKNIENVVFSNNVFNNSKKSFLELPDSFEFEITFDLQTFLNGKLQKNQDSYTISFGNSDQENDDILKYDNFYLSKNDEDDSITLWGDFTNLPLSDVKKNNLKRPDLNYINTIMWKLITDYKKSFTNNLKYNVESITELFDK